MPDDATPATPKKDFPFGSRKKTIFLDNLRKYGSVYFAAKQAGIDRSTAYRHRAGDSEFAEAWDDAKEDALDLLEATAHKRAHETSDTLTIFLLKAGRPDKYRDPVQRIAQTDSQGNDLPPGVHNDEQLIAKALGIIARGSPDTLASLLRLARSGSEAEPEDTAG